MASIHSAKKESIKTSGKGGIIFAILLVGVAFVVGALVIVFYDTASETVAPDLDLKKPPSQADAMGGILGEWWEEDAAFDDDEEEKPTMLRTVDTRGNTTYLPLKTVTLHRPGKGKPVKAMKFATATGRKMKPLQDDTISAAKFVHPSVKRVGEKGKFKITGNTGGAGKDKGQGEDTGQTEGEKGGKMGEGKEAGGGGK